MRNDFPFPPSDCWPARPSFPTLLAVFLAAVLLGAGGLLATPTTFPPGNYASEEAAGAVAITVTYEKDPPSITLNFPGRTEDYGIERRVWGTTAWTVMRAGRNAYNPAGTKISSWTDTAVSVGTAYEYRVRGEWNNSLDNSGQQFYPYGFVLAGIEVDKTGDKGRMILLVDNTVPTALPFEYNRLKEDLIGEGWRIHELQVAPATSWGGHLGNPADNQATWAIREQIKTIYNGSPTNDKPKFVYILGHVPVPWVGSGRNVAPDGHGNHTGAYPSDTFYADTNNNWGDTETYDQNSTVLRGDTSVPEPRQYNFPGDKIYDRQYLEYIANLEMGFGRVDFFGMETYFRTSEKELLRRYLNKAHDYRHLKNDMAVLGTTGRRMLLRNGFSTVDLTMHRWASTTVGIDNFEYSEAFPGGISYGNDHGPYLAYFPANEGSGYLGEYEKDIHTALFAKHGVNAAFYGGFQSYRFDWGLDNNQILAFLAAEGLSLGYATAHGPHLLHFTGLGENFALCIRRTLNDNSTTMVALPPYLPPEGNDYPNHSPASNVRARGVFMAWMGDPSLKLFPVLPASNLTVTGGSSVTLNWTASPDTAIQGYNVYRASSMTGTWTKLNTGGFITGSSFVDTSPLSGKNIYAVRAVKLETTGSGSYFNEAQSLFATHDPVGAVILPSVQTLTVQMNRGSYTPSTGGAMTIANGGSGAFTNLQATPASDWLAVTSFNGTNLQIAPNANADTLALGTHKGAILLTADNANPVYIPVVLTVNGQGGVFEPVADTLADGKTGATTTNYGTSTICDLSKNDRRLYQKFDLSNELGQVVERAVLSIIVTDATAPQLDVYAFNNNTWSEATLTYAARPDDANIGTLLATQTGSGTGRLDFDVTEFVESRIMEDGILSFMVKCPVEPSNIAKVAMREGYGVYLTVDFGGTVTSWLTLSSRDFNEDTTGNGTIDNTSPVVATLTGADTFTGTNGEDFVANGKAIISNLPAGLTATLTRTSDTTLTVGLSGFAANHNYTHSISNLSIRFNDTAFSGGARQNVMGFSANGLRVNFNGLVVLNDADSGPGSLRQAVADAPDGSVLTFDPSVAQIALTSEIPVAKSVTFEGGGRVAIDGGNATRLFNINGTGAQTVAFRRITLQNGWISASGGGAIYIFDGTLLAQDCSFLGNRADATGDDAGAVNIRSGVTGATFTGCYFEGNSCDDDGGAIYAQSALTVINSTFYQNVSGDQGGAIYADNQPAEIYNCTLLENGAGTGEGVIQATGDSGAVIHSTVIYNPSAPYEIESLNSTTLPSVVLSNCFGNLTRMANYGTRIAASGGVNSSSSPQISTPANNGGLTKTAAIQAGSPLIDAGSNPRALTTDQRGAGFVRVSGGACDIGAFEFGQPSALPYESWRDSRGLDEVTGAPGADLDGNGLVNLLEYALNAGAGAPASGVLPVSTSDGTNLTISYRRNVDATDLIYTVQSSTDLVIWTNETAGTKSATIDADTEQWGFSKPLGGQRLFLRLKVELAP